MSEMKVETALRLKSVALPAEHGGWAFLYEPILAGLLLAPSAAGFLLSLSALGVFLIHQPLKIAVKDRLKGKRYLRTQWAERFAALYVLLALAGCLLAYLSVGTVFLPPILLAVPFAAVQLYYDASNRGREGVAEICGAVALSALAPALTLIAGWTLAEALGLWLILAARAVTSILYVRVRLRLEKGKPVDTRVAVGSHVAAALLFAVLATLAFTPKLAVVAFVVLLARAAHGLSRYRRPTPAKHIGFQEVGFGLLTVLLTVAGYKLPF
ncbi:MAG: YwiC-like family protein [Anaerolineae bacterium]